MCSPADQTKSEGAELTLATNTGGLAPDGFYTPAPEIRLFMVDLTPIGLYTLFHERADLLSALSADATPLIPSRRRRLICEALAETEDVTRKAHIVEEFLRTLAPGRTPRWVDQIFAA